VADITTPSSIISKYRTNEPQAKFTSLPAVPGLKWAEKCFQIGKEQIDIIGINHVNDVNSCTAFPKIAAEWLLQLSPGDLR
jgi:hypothetical protein